MLFMLSLRNRQTSSSAVLLSALFVSQTQKSPQLIHYSQSWCILAAGGALDSKDVAFRISVLNISFFFSGGSQHKQNFDMGVIAIFASRLLSLAPKWLSSASVTAVMTFAA